MYLSCNKDDDDDDDDIDRVMRELEAVKQEADMLQEQMKMIKYDIQKVRLHRLHRNAAVLFLFLLL